jgi:hypothetical protein
MPYALFVEVDNSREDPDTGRAGLRDELAPALKAMPGFISTVLMTAYERGVGMAVIVFDTKEHAEALAAGLVVGAELRPGVIVQRVELLEVNVMAPG